MLVSTRCFCHLSAILFAADAVTAHACTVCNSRAGHQIRAGIFNGHFLQTCLLVVAPFPLFALAVLLLHWVTSCLESGSRRTPRQIVNDAVLLRDLSPLPLQAEPTA